jgi:hypothetical protein
VNDDGYEDFHELLICVTKYTELIGTFIQSPDLNAITILVIKLTENPSPMDDSKFLVSMKSIYGLGALQGLEQKVPSQAMTPLRTEIEGLRDEIETLIQERDRKRKYANDAEVQMKKLDAELIHATRENERLLEVFSVIARGQRVFC